MPETLSDYLTALRGSKSRYRVAKDLGVAYSTLYRWESGKGEPDVSSLKRLALYYGLAPAELLDRLRKEVATHG